MSITLSKRIFLDVKNFSSSAIISAEKPREGSLSRIFRILFGLVRTAVVMNIRLNNSRKMLEATMRNDYNIFLNSDERSKEDILIKWEVFSKSLNEHMKTKPKNSNIFSNSIIRNAEKIIGIAHSFTNKLENELYPNINTPRSEQELKEIAKKFEHLPKDMMKEIVSDVRFETV